jgi:hypothetical protein
MIKKTNIAERRIALVQDNTARIEKMIREKFGSCSIGSHSSSNLYKTSIPKGDVHRVRAAFAYVGDEMFENSNGRIVDTGNGTVAKIENVSCSIYYDAQDGQSILSRALGRAKRMKLIVPVYLHRKVIPLTDRQGLISR